MAENITRVVTLIFLRGLADPGKERIILTHLNCSAKGRVKNLDAVEEEEEEKQKQLG